MFRDHDKFSGAPKCPAFDLVISHSYHYNNVIFPYPTPIFSKFYVFFGLVRVLAEVDKAFAW
jgi:hypothetical protein